MRTLQALVGISWVVFWVYWIAKAVQSKPNVRGGAARRRPRAIIFLILLVIIIVRPRGSTSFGYVISHNKPWLAITGTILFYCGLGVALWARRHLGRNWGMPMSLKKDPQLVTSGPYAVIRHPIYTGIILAALGTLLVESIVWLFALGVSSAYFTYSAFQEDKIMAKQFPKTYPAYKARTKLLIPYIF